MDSDKRRPVVKAREVVNIDDDVSLAGTNKCHAISVDDYPYPEEEEEDRNLHLAIMASLSNQNPTTATAASSSYSRNSNRTTGQRNPFFIDQYPTIATAASSSSNGSNSSRQRKPLFIDLDNYDDDDDVQVLLQPPFIFNSNSNSSATGKSKRPASIIEIDIGEPSTAATFMCEICVEPKPCSEMFLVMGCTHSYCSECMVRYVASKLQDNITQIRCPLAGSGSGCHGLLEPEHCRPILPPEVFDRWGSALCEAAILASDKFYCPFKDCSALLIMDSDNDNDNVNVLLQSECPNCRRLFCVQCKVPWHSGIECQEFQKLNKDEREREDIMLMQLAKNNRWMRCPKCRFYVEKSMGCLYMRCRCGYTFCYNCGAPLTSHYCISCKR